MSDNGPISSGGTASGGGAGLAEYSSTDPGPGGRLTPGKPMPKPLQYGLGVYVTGMFFCLLYLLVKTWPLNVASPFEKTEFFWGTVTLPAEIRLMFVAAIAGAFGAYVHLATSFADFAGNEQLKVSWGWWYLLRPFIGMALAEVVYLSLRGGLLTGSGGATGAISVYGVSAVAALTGLFSKQATDKLREVFETLFRTTQKVERKDALPSTGPQLAPAVPETKASAAGVGK